MRGVSYTDDEKAVMAKLAGDSSLSHQQRVEGFFDSFKGSDRNPDAVSQRFRKLSADARKAAGLPPAPRGRPRKEAEAVPTKTVRRAPAKTTTVVAAAAEKKRRPSARPMNGNGNGNGHSNGNGHPNGNGHAAAPAPVVAVSNGVHNIEVLFEGVRLSGAARDVGKLLQAVG